MRGFLEKRKRFFIDNLWVQIKNLAALLAVDDEAPLADVYTPVATLEATQGQI